MSEKEQLKRWTAGCLLGSLIIGWLFLLFWENPWSKEKIVNWCNNNNCTLVSHSKPWMNDHGPFGSSRTNDNDTYYKAVVKDKTGKERTVWFRLHSHGIEAKEEGNVQQPTRPGSTGTTQPSSPTGSGGYNRTGTGGSTYGR